MSFGIAGIGTVLADRRVAAAQLGGAELLADVGFEARHEPTGGDVSPWELSAAAGRAALADAGVEARDLDLVLVVGRFRIEYFTWALSLGVEKELGARCPAMDVTDWTAGSLLAGLRLARAKFHADPGLRNVLVVAHQRQADLVDPRAAQDQPLWPIGDGAAALVLRRDAPGPAVLGHAFHTDGRGSPLLGMRSMVVDEGPNPDSFYEQQWAMAKFLTVRDAAAWRADYRQRAARQLPALVRTAAERAGLRADAFARVLGGFLYPDVADDLRAALGVPVRSHNAHGMLGGAEHGFVLDELRRDASLRGQHVALVHAGLPASFGATVLRV
ncbi:MAG: hypothetical protein LC624_00560 [Halobacteriales archaeon]|nr:hypothetical protein [Halobacteriales archaeon]